MRVHCQSIEVVTCPVEGFKLGPAELSGRCRVFAPHAKNPVTCGQEGIDCSHGSNCLITQAIHGVASSIVRLQICCDDAHQPFTTGHASVLRTQLSSWTFGLSSSAVGPSLTPWISIPCT